MSTPQVERELTAVLHRHAEDAMSRTDTQTELLELNARIESRARHDRRRWVVGGGLAAAAVLVAGAVLWPGDQAEDRSGPASRPEERNAEQVADGFVEAFAAGDVAEASSYLQAGAAPWEGWHEDLRLKGVLRPQYLLQPCEATGTSTLGTAVTCPFEYHLLRSEELGLGPFGNNEFTVLVDGGKVVSAEVFRDWFNNGQSALFEAIGAYVKDNHPGDWAAMNIPGDGSPAEQRRARRLWEQRTREFVEAHTAK